MTEKNSEFSIQSSELKRTVDLHTHTYYSDGVLSPAQLVEKAKKIGLSAIAITDHDSVSGLSEGLATGKKLGVEVVPGIEVTSYPDETQEYHLLGYFVDWKNKDLQKNLATFQKDREERAKKEVEKLNDLGFSANFGDLKAMSRGTIVKPHIAWSVISDPQNKELLKKKFGHIPTTGEFIVKYLIPGAEAYVPRKTLKPKEAIDLLHKYSAVVVLAHPCWSITRKVVDGEKKIISYDSIEKGTLVFDDEKIGDLVKLGIDGIEIYAHRESEEDTKKCVEHFGKIAKKSGLLVTGGSDYHGFGSAGKELGFTNFYLKVPYKILEDLRLNIKK